MDRSRNQGKTRVVREVVERQVLDDDEDDLPVSIRQHNKGGLDPNKTVEQQVFGSATVLDSEGAQVYTDWKQIAERQRAMEANRSKRGSLDESFRPLAASSFVEPGVSNPVALNMSLDVSGINYPSPPPPTQPWRPASPFASTTLPAYVSPATYTPAASRTLPLPGSQPVYRSTSQPPVRRYSTVPPQSSVSLPLMNTSREDRLKQRLEEVENQIARVNVALQSQGIETELSEESQLRLISFLQRRLLDLEHKVAEIEESGGGFSMEEDNLGMTPDSFERSGCPLKRDRSRREERKEEEHSLLFDLQDLINQENSND